MLASLLHFYMKRIDLATRVRALTQHLVYDEVGEPGIGGKGAEGDEVQRPDQTDPDEKNARGLLPKTPPGIWVTALEAPEAEVVKGALRAVPTDFGEVNTKPWKAIYSDIVGKKEMIAGHAVPELTIAGEKGFAFEIRTPKREERSTYGY